ncbi:MAG TPA: DUF512 domain-containing protein [Desulfuromonadaceae bacterium]|jgi:putative radical SAM enzyme (TIGR03279 family)
MQGIRIQAVIPGSIADEMEVQPGDRLLAINGHPLLDIIDYSYYLASDDEILLEVSKPNKEIWELEISRDPAVPLGFIFEAPKPVRCRNNCIFCFVHQLPKGLRKPLYVKDEDYRLSFLNGNYVTLANLKAAELARITKQRLSPLYISVHTTNPELRQFMLGSKNIPQILEQLQKLAQARILMHTQVVLCPGINDGPELARTVADLSDLYPAVQSLAIVPLGLTRHRQRLPDLTAVDSDYARGFIEVWGPQARRINRRLGQPFLFLADEFYLKANLPFPPLREYGDLPQIENGVGLVPLFLKDAAQVLRRARPLRAINVTVVTGVSALSFVEEFLNKLEEKTGVRLKAVAIENRLLGQSVTVSGLVSGNDIVAALKDVEIGDALLVPDVMLKEGEGVFLDDVSLEDLGQRAGCRVITFDATPQGCYRAIQGLTEQH